MLAQRIPRALALELLLTGDSIDAARAAEIGLVNRVVDDGAALVEAIGLADADRRQRPAGGDGDQADRAVRGGDWAAAAAVGRGGQGDGAGLRLGRTPGKGPGRSPRSALRCGRDADGRPDAPAPSPTCSADQAEAPGGIRVQRGTAGTARVRAGLRPRGLTRAGGPPGDGPPGRLRPCGVGADGRRTRPAGPRRAASGTAARAPASWRRPSSARRPAGSCCPGRCSPPCWPRPRSSASPMNSVAGCAAARPRGR